MKGGAERPQLPADVWIYKVVLPYMSVVDVQAFLRSNKELRFLPLDKSDTIWRALCLRDFGLVPSRSDAGSLEQAYFKLRKRGLQRIDYASLDYGPNISRQFALGPVDAARTWWYHVQQGAFYRRSDTNDVLICITSTVCAYSTVPYHYCWDSECGQGDFQRFGDPSVVDTLSGAQIELLDPLEVDVALLPAALLDVTDGVNPTALVLLRDETEALTVPCPRGLLERLEELLDSGEDVDVRLMRFQDRLFLLDCEYRAT